MPTAAFARAFYDVLTARLDDSGDQVRIAAASAMSSLLPAVTAEAEAASGLHMEAGEGGDVQDAAGAGTSDGARATTSVTLQDLIAAALSRQRGGDTCQAFSVRATCMATYCFGPLALCSRCMCICV